MKKCDPKVRSTCKSDKEIEEWLMGKYMITIENNWHFYSNEYGSDSDRVYPAAKFRWFPINP